MCFSIDLIYNSFKPFWMIIWLFILKFVEIFCPLEKDSNKFVQQKLFHVDINYLQNNRKSKIRNRMTFTNNQIFTICFIDKKGIPISNMICVATENIKRHKDGCKCIIAYLPLGKNNKEFPDGTGFYVFYNSKKIATGVLGDSIGDMENY